MDLAYILPGLAVGALVGATGVGGGAVMTPMLTTGFGIAPGVAVGTDLLFAALTKSAGTLTHRLQGSVDWRVVRLLCTGSLPAAALTLLTMQQLNVHAKPAVLEIGLAVALAITATVMLSGKRFAFKAVRTGRLAARTIALGTVAAGALLGTMVSLTSVGAGALGATLLLGLHPKMAAIRVAGTDIAHAVPLTAVAGLGHLWLGLVNLDLLSGLLLGSIPGIVLGTLIGKRLPERLLRRALAITLLGVSTNLILKQFR